MKITISCKIYRQPDVGPNIRIYHNRSCVYDNQNLDCDQHIALSIEHIQAVNLLEIEHWGKNPGAVISGDIAFEIQEIKFDCITLPRTMMFNQIFYPNWQFGPVENRITDNCYLGFNGVWCLAWPRDPAIWIMDYLEQELFPESALA